MKADEPAPLDEPFTSFLVACDEALAAGATPSVAGAVEETPELRVRLERGLAFLQRLHRLRLQHRSAVLCSPKRGASDSHSTPPRDPDPAGTADFVPESRARYTLTRLHATGGIGRVWVARDGDLGRDVALKELQPERAGNAVFSKRFVHEARITGQLEHPGIVPVYELVQGSDDQQQFYTMRFIKGRTLSDAARVYHLERAAGKADHLEQITLLNAFVGVCNAVAYAHSRGVIHRDLKGQNVVLGDFGAVIVLDWGFAKVVGDPEEGTEVPALVLDGAPDQTVQGQVIGTPAYRAPEQAMGRLDLIDRRTDVYGLGAMLYGILTGQAPFTGSDTQEVLRKVREEEPPPPHRVSNGVPAALEAVCLRALAKKPGERYNSASDLAREVQRWLADEPVAAYREGLAARLGRWARRHKPVVAGAAVLVTTAVAALVVGLWLIGQEQAQTARVEAEAKEKLRTQLYFQSIALAEREWSVGNMRRADQVLNACPEEIRGWEWHYLKRLRLNPPQHFRGHVNGARSVAFSPDGKRLASGGWDKMARVWETATGGQILALPDHSTGIMGVGVTFSRDGTVLAYSEGKDFRLSDAPTGQTIHPIPGRYSQIWGLAFSPDGKRIAAGDINARVTIWSVSSGQHVLTLGDHQDRVRCVAYSPDGRHLAAGVERVGVKIWEPDTGRLLDILNGPWVEALAVAYSPDGRFLAAGGGDTATRAKAEVIIWDTATGLKAWTLRGHLNSVWSLAFSPDSRRLASASDDKTVKVWDVRTGEEAITLRGHTGGVRGVAFSPDGHRLASASLDESIRIWDATPLVDEKPAYELLTFCGHKERVWGLAFSPDGGRLASGSNDHSVRVWDPRSGHEFSTVPEQPGVVWSLAFSPNGQRLAVASADKTARVWDLATGQEILSLQGRRSLTTCVAYSPDGQTLATSGYDSTVRICDARTGKEVHRLEGHVLWLWSLTYSPNGRYLASAGADKFVKVWDVNSGQEVHSLPGHKAAIRCVAFSPDNQRLASASDDNTVKVWDVATGKELLTLSRHAAGVNTVAFSPDGGYLASGGEDDTVRVWEAATGQEIRVLRGHTDRVQSVAFSPDGRLLASASYDKTVKIWDAASLLGKPPPSAADPGT